MKKLLFSCLVGFSLVILLIYFGSKPMLDALGYQARSGLKITSYPEASVFINGEAQGKTPFEDDNLTSGEYQVKLVSTDSSWQGLVRLTRGTVTVVNRELSPKTGVSSGETLTLDDGGGVIITSTPDQALVSINGKPYGKTPLSVSNLEPGGYTFLLEHDNYLKRSIKATLPTGKFLHLEVDLALTEANLATSVTQPAVSTLPKLIVLQTPTGYLRVREKPSLSGAEIGKVSPGDNLTYIEEVPGWYKVRLENGTEGYVSSSYIQKQP